MLEDKGESVPAGVPVQHLTSEEEVNLYVERKQVANFVNLVACQVEGKFVRLVAPHYRRTEQEGRIELLLRLVAARFGPLPEAAEALVREANAETLDHWADAVLTAKTLKQLLNGHAAPKRRRAAATTRRR